VNSLDVHASVQVRSDLDIRFDDGVVLAGNYRFLIDNRASAILVAVQRNGTLAAVQSDDDVRKIYALSTEGSDGSVDAALSRDIRRLHEAGLLLVAGIPPSTRSQEPIDALSVRVKVDSGKLLTLVTVLSGWSILRRHSVEYALVAVASAVLVWSAVSLTPSQLALAAAHLPVWAGTLIFPLTVLVVIWHEAGHVAAMRRAGRRPLRAGVGVYLISVVLYVDLSTLIAEPANVRRRVDMAGLAHDASLLALIVVIAPATGLQTISDLATGIGIAVLLFSLNPWIHSDLSWLLTDTCPGFNRSMWLQEPTRFLRLLRGERANPQTRPATVTSRAQVLLGTVWIIVTGLWFWKLRDGIETANSQNPDLLWHLVWLGGSGAVAVIGIGATISALLRRQK
jgi:hypothetical protein